MSSMADPLLRGRMFKKLVEHRCAPVCAKYGLKQLEAEVLYYMSKLDGSTTSSEICRSLMANKGQISQTMDSLCRRGYLLAAADASDRRFIHFGLSPQARDVAAEIKTVHDRLQQDIFRDIPEEELARFKSTAHKLLQRINAIMDAEL